MFLLIERGITNNILLQVENSELWLIYNSNDYNVKQSFRHLNALNIPTIREHYID